LLGDIAHIAGLVVDGEHPHPFPWCDVVTSTTHKTLRGPRGGLILCKKELAEKIDKAVFPGLQGGPMDHVVAAKAICLFEAMQPEFKEYQHQIIFNARAMAKEFVKQEIPVISGGTDNHMMVLDISKFNDNPKFVQDELDKLGIYVNRNSIPFDSRPPFNPSGIRIGSPAITARGFKEKDAVLVARLVAQFIKNSGDIKVKVEIKKEVQKLVAKFPIYEDF
jgi:glycine hydroxymethyltransferase